MESTQPEINNPVESTETAQNVTNASKTIKIESVPKTSLKSSQEKNFRKQIIDNIPAIADIIDKIWPKKSSIMFSKQKNYTNVYFINDEPCFVQTKDNNDALVPHLKLLHKCKKLINF